jgi:hypothetical protein
MSALIVTAILRQLTNLAQVFARPTIPGRTVPRPLTLFRLAISRSRGAASACAAPLVGAGATITQLVDLGGGQLVWLRTGSTHPK